MKEVQAIVAEIDLKVGNLIRRLRQKEAENDKLAADLEQSTQTVESLQSRIQLLEEENKILRIAQTLTTGTDTTDTKKQIDKLVREIDMCISLLNG